MAVHDPASTVKNDSNISMFLSRVSLWTVERADVSAWVEQAPFAFWIVEALRREDKAASLTALLAYLRAKLPVTANKVIASGGAAGPRYWLEMSVDCITTGPARGAE